MEGKSMESKKAENKMEIVGSLKYAWNAVLEKKLYKLYAILAVLSLCASALSLFIKSIPLIALPYFLVVLAGALAGIYLFPKFIHGKLVDEKIAGTKYSFSLFVKYFLVSITVSLHTFLFWREKKWLALYLPLIASIALIGVGAAAGNFGGSKILLFAGIALFAASCLALAIAWVYFSLRLCQAVGIALCDPSLGLGECSKKSWAITEGKVINIFAINFVFGLVALVIMVPFIIFGLIPVVGKLPVALMTALMNSVYLGAQAYLYIYIFKHVSAASLTAKKQEKKK